MQMMDAEFISKAVPVWAALVLNGLQTTLQDCPPQVPLLHVSLRSDSFASHGCIYDALMVFFFFSIAWLSYKGLDVLA